MADLLSEFGMFYKYSFCSTTEEIDMIGIALKRKQVINFLAKIGDKYHSIPLPSDIPVQVSLLISSGVELIAQRIGTRVSCSSLAKTLTQSAIPHQRADVHIVKVSSQFSICIFIYNISPDNSGKAM